MQVSHNIVHSVLNPKMWCAMRKNVSRTVWRFQLEKWNNPLGQVCDTMYHQLIQYWQTISASHVKSRGPSAQVILIWTMILLRKSILNFCSVTIFLKLNIIESAIFWLKTEWTTYIVWNLHGIKKNLKHSNVQLNNA